MDRTKFIIIVTGVLCGESRVQSTHAITWSEIIDMWFAKKSNFQYGVGAIDSEKDVLGYTQVWIETPLTSVMQYVLERHSEDEVVRHEFPEPAWEFEEPVIIWGTGKAGGWTGMGSQVGPASAT